mmetsp:Transcript_43648/g.76944  ORF Transcript_43648/g.76944 Transcript_43648/m.76944 type:complete len:152 (+) Transcript_43648:40-495(+)
MNSLSILIALALLVCSLAFQFPTSVRQSRIQLMSAANEDAIFAAEKAALEASEKYGATSKEARLAWETVEEMNAASRPVNAMLKNLDVECDVTNSEECKEFYKAMDELAKLTKEGSADAAGELADKNKDLLAENRRLREELSELRAGKRDM